MEPVIPTRAQNRRSQSRPHRGSVLIMAFFCAILVFVYVATKRANPVMLDQRGHPLNQSSAADEVMPAVATACGLCGLDCGKAGHRTCIRRSRHGVSAASGCANVYAILLESGVIASGQNIRETEVFRRSLELGLISSLTADSEAISSIDPNAPTSDVLLQINGMWCSACGWLIEHALKKLPGIVSVEVLFASDLAEDKVLSAVSATRGNCQPSISKARLSSYRVRRG